jgi:gamma-glutamyltranspeptidase/glutathione hydrolase
MPHAAVATPHPAAAAAAREIFASGGNAIDAAVGAMLACCVATPGAVGLGGYGGSLVAYLAASRETVAIDFDSRAPLAYGPDLFDSAERYESGYRSITVPAVVAGLATALERFGAMSWAAVSAPAIRLAQGGINMTPDLRRQLLAFATKADATSRRALFPAGDVPEAGATWRQPDLARLLIRLADEGPQAFYYGDVPRRIIQQTSAGGSVLSAADFERCQAELIEPLSINYRGYQVLTPPPPSGGLTSLQILKVLEFFDLSALEPWGADFFHLFAEAAKLCWQDRARHFGDPHVVPIPVEELLSTDTARAKASQIDRHRAGPSNGHLPPSPPHTANIIATDAADNIVSVTATHGYLYGSQVAIDGLGLVLGHGMSRFDLATGSPNGPAPGKRMFHNMSPAIVLDRAGQPWAAVGLPGGPKIVTVTAQLLVNLMDFHAAPLAAVTAPRLHVETAEPIALSASMPEPVVAALRQLGHTITQGQTVGGQPDEIGGKANALRIDRPTETILAASQAGEAAAVII